ncbi:DUF2264 domain-containing protein [Actinacidiphila sp. bgisy145]|uniref:DUF2264 domain-containing protein n=1 Tax=Actinacidiphila sp. bgisy145 TaxID=3413792 RepID=UPI003EB8C633
MSGNGNGNGPSGGSGPFVLPAPDAERSPLTGWTRAHWEAVGRRWLSRIEPYDSAGGALPRLPGRVTGDGERRESMEAVGRSFLLAAPLIAGARGTEAEALTERYARALLAGTDPDGAESWPRGVTCRAPVTGVTNSIVEAANIAFGLHISRERLWDRLAPAERRRIADWLRHHARLEVWHNNWQLFPAMAEGFLRSVGEDTSGCTGTRNVRRVESWYLEQGWYTDGPEHAVDYYNAWAIHPYLWAWYRMTDRTATPDGARHLERLGAFAGSWADTVAPDGSMLHVGRSLTYRTAALAALWCAEISGVNPLTPGATRRLASGVLARFTAAGVGIAHPPELGWYRPYEPIAQTYSGFGSSYLAGIGFLGLAIDQDAPVWTAAEQPQPTERGPRTRVMPELGWLLRTQQDGIVRLVNHGSDHCEIPVEPTRADPDDPHYAKFGYSSHTAPGTAAGWTANVDGHLALLDAGGRASHRGVIRAMRVEGAVAGSVHLPQLDGRLLPGCSVVSVTVLDGDLELRAHLVRTPRPRPVREGGWAVADTSPLTTRTPGGPGTARTAAVTRADGLTATVVGLYGWQHAATHAERDTNAMGPYSAVPVLTATAGTPTTVLVSLHTLTRTAPTPTDLADLATAVRVEVHGTVLHAHWRTGPHHTLDLATFVPWDGEVPAAY